MDLLAVKVATLVGFFVLTLAMVSFPILLWDKIRGMRDPRRRHLCEAAVSYLSCLGGGVFLATIFLHLLPDSRVQLAKGLELYGIRTKFPLLEFVCILGLLFVLTIEQLVLMWKEKEDSKMLNALTPDGPATRSPLPHYGALHGDPFYSRGHTSPTGSIPRGGTPEATSEEEDPEFHSVHEDPSSHSVLRTFILVLSLSLHSVFEGMAIGLQQDVQALVQVLVAVAIHKCILAFTLGLNLRPSRLRKCSVVASALVFSAMAPLGIGGSLLLQGGGHASVLASGILQGISCGTFVYVTFFEVLPHEMNIAENRVGKLLSLMLGVAIITVLLFVFPMS